jgi:hypothetical protein
MMEERHCLYRSIDETAMALDADARPYRQLMSPLISNWEKLVAEFLQFGQ